MNAPWVAAALGVLLIEAVVAVLLASPPQLLSAAVASCGPGCSFKIGYWDGITFTWLALAASAVLLVARRIGRRLAAVIQLLGLAMSLVSIALAVSGAPIQLTRFSGTGSAGLVAGYATAWAVLATAGAVSMLLAARANPRPPPPGA